MPAWANSWARDSGVLLCSQVAALAVTSALGILIARSLGPSDWGLFSGFLGLSAAFSVLVDFGLATYLLRELSRLWAQDRRNAKGFLHEGGQLVVGALTLNACLGVVLVLGTLLATVVLRSEPNVSVALVGLVGYTALLAASTGLETVFRARRELRWVVAATLLQNGMLLLLVGLSLLEGTGIVGIVLGYVVAGIARVGFVSYRIFSSSLGLGVPRIRAVWQLAGRSLPFALNTAGLVAIPQLDPLLLAAVSTTAAGYFAVGARLVGPALLIPAASSSALYPFLAGRRQRSDPAWRMGALLGLIGAAVAAVGIAVAPFLVPTALGPDYTQGVPTVQVMLLVLPFTFSSSGLLVGLYTCGLERQVLMVTAGSAIAGSAAIVAGQVMVGSAAAGLGYVVRQVLYFGALAALAIFHERSRAARWPLAATPAGAYEAARADVGQGPAI